MRKINSSVLRQDWPWVNSPRVKPKCLNPFCSGSTGSTLSRVWFQVGSQKTGKLWAFPTHHSPPRKREPPPQTWRQVCLLLSPRGTHCSLQKKSFQNQVPRFYLMKHMPISLSILSQWQQLPFSHHVVVCKALLYLLCEECNAGVNIAILHLKG